MFASPFRATPRQRRGFPSFGFPPLRLSLRALCTGLFALVMLAGASLAGAAGPADLLKDKRVLITGGTPTGANLGRADMQRQLQELGAATATAMGANLLTEHQLRIELFPEPGGDPSDTALAARVKAGAVDRLIVLLAVARPDRHVELVAQIYELRINALGGLDNERLWQGSTAVTFAQMSTHAPWLAATFMAYDLLDVMVAGQLIAAPAPPDRLVADMMFDCAAIHNANALALKASGEDPAGQQKFIDGYTATGTAFSSAQYAAQKTAETNQTVRQMMEQVQKSTDTDAAREYLAELDARIEHCRRYQRRHGDLITARMKK